ncbi:unnamed protein product [Hydatigera taeniaeformis]|uniref:DUF5732 domain-containing protein n=1 Tax=Hydatigena taeniaeformis TaxID=6205 RepID=A0A0R3WZ43_HYDTA|nr:unnamed protein product [Hydatigera taeniaeformis]
MKEKRMDGEKENDSPQALEFEAIDRSGMATTSAVLSTSCQRCDETVHRKRESTDSGLDCSTFLSSEAGTFVPSFTPSTSPLVKSQPFKRFRKSSPEIWRPYL